MHTIKITPNLLFVNKRQIYQIAESNRKNRFGSVNRIESNFFWPELECSNSEDFTDDDVRKYVGVNIVCIIRFLCHTVVEKESKINFELSFSGRRQQRQEMTEIRAKSTPL